MRAVRPWRPGAPATPELVEQPEPTPGPGEVLLEVVATALNRADLLQVRGQYPAPPGESEIPGLEAAGRVVALGRETSGVTLGGCYAALLAGGGQAERVAVPVGQLLPLPAGWSFDEAAALPEAAITAWTNLVDEGALAAGEVVVIAGATSGVGTFAVQLGRALGGRVIAVGRDLERLARLRELGAEHLLELGPELGARLHRATGGVGANLVLDLVGGEQTAELLATLAPRGRLVLLGLTAGRSATLDLARLLRDRLRLVGSVLRPRPRSEKARLVGDFLAFAGERLERRELVPVIDRRFELGEIAAAYQHLASGRPLGKVVVRVAD